MRGADQSWEFTNPGTLMQKQMRIVTQEECRDFWVRYIKYKTREGWNKTCPILYPNPSNRKYGYGSSKALLFIGKNTLKVIPGWILAQTAALQSLRLAVH